jgi:regulator of RNase E activity RraA
VDDFDREEISRLVELFDELGCAQLRDASARYTKAVPSGVLRRIAGQRLAGPAFPVTTDNDMLPCLQALDAAPAGWVLVLCNTAAESEALAGDILVTAAVAQQLGGLVVDGAVRDTDTLGDLGLTVFARTVNYVSAKTAHVPATTVPQVVRLGELPLRPGDWIFGDGDGVAIVAAEHVRAVFNGALMLTRREMELKERLRGGETLGEICGLDEFVAGRGPLRFEI